MKKNLLFGLLILALLALPLLGACGGEPAAPAETPAETPAATPEPEVIKLIYAIDGVDKSGPAQFTKYFEEYIEENTGGRVQFENYFNGVLGSAPEMLELMSTGSVDMTNLLTGMYKEKMPLHNFPHWQLGSAENALDIVQKLYFGIPETAAILEEEQKENNIKILYCNYLGENGIMTKKAINSLADLKGKKLGSSIPQKAYETLGVNVINVAPPDMYEALSRSVVDCTPMPLEPMVAMKWYEVCEAYYFDGSFAAGQQMTINLDTWNNLPDDIKQVFLDASEKTVPYSIQRGSEINEEYVNIVKDAGLIVDRLPAEDCQTLYSLNYKLQAEEMLAIAAKVGKTAQAETLMKNVDELVLGK